MIQRKQTIFEVGTRAAQIVFGVTGLYVCPLCSRGFNHEALKAGILTIEHVPPASLGGKGICLTCKACNNSAGTRLDSEVRRRAEQRDFADLIAGARKDYTGHIRLTIAGETVNARVSRDRDNRIRIEILGKSNNPTAVKRIEAHMSKQAAAGGGHGDKYQITSRARYRKRRSDVSYLRAGYLTAFAAFGYSYIFSEPLAVVRAQINAPDDVIIGPWTFAASDDDPTRRLVIIDSLDALLVRFGELGVLLPVPYRSTDLYSDLAARYTSNERVTISGRQVPWPQDLVMAQDFAADSPSEGGDV